MKKSMTTEQLARQAIKDVKAMSRDQKAKLRGTPGSRIRAI